MESRIAQLERRVAVLEAEARPRRRVRPGDAALLEAIRSALGARVFHVADLLALAEAVPELRQVLEARGLREARRIGYALRGIVRRGGWAGGWQLEAVTTTNAGAIWCVMPAT
jgi:hypothetical protein